MHIYVAIDFHFVVHIWIYNWHGNGSWWYAALIGIIGRLSKSQLECNSTAYQPHTIISSHFQRETIGTITGNFS